MILSAGELSHEVNYFCNENVPVEKERGRIIVVFISLPEH